MRTRFAAVVLILGAFVATGSVAGAAGPKVKPSISCTITGTATISPGLSSSLAVQTITVTTTLSGCSGSSVAGITGSSSGTTSSTGKKPSNCASLLKKSVTKTTSSIKWNNGDTSGDLYKTTLFGGTANAKGKITSGDFAKGKLLSTLSYSLGAGQNCSTIPITSATLTGTFTIT